MQYLLLFTATMVTRTGLVVTERVYCLPCISSEESFYLTC